MTAITKFPAIKSVEQKQQGQEGQQATTAQTEDTNFYLGDDRFWDAWGAKLLYTLISLKSWGLIASMAATTWMLVHRNQTILALAADKVDLAEIENLSIGITGAQWVTFNVTIWTMLYGIKEVKKVAEKTKKRKD